MSEQLSIFPKARIEQLEARVVELSERLLIKEKEIEQLQKIVKLDSDIHSIKNDLNYIVNEMRINKEKPKDPKRHYCSDHRDWIDDNGYVACSLQQKYGSSPQVQQQKESKRRIISNCNECKRLKYID